MPTPLTTIAILGAAAAGVHLYRLYRWVTYGERGVTLQGWMDIGRIKAEVARLEAQEERWLREAGANVGVNGR